MIKLHKGAKLFFEASPLIHTNTWRLIWGLIYLVCCSGVDLTDRCSHVSVPVGMTTAYNALFWSVYSSALWLCGSFNDVNTAFFTGIVMCHTLSCGKSLAEDEWVQEKESAV